MRFQDRDAAILETIHVFDGVMTRRHIKALFWPEASEQAMEQRLSKLYHNGYLDWPDAEQRRKRPNPEPIVWLGWKGALSLASQMGVSVQQPTATNENQMRRLESRLRDKGFRWLREPNWNQLLHDIAVADFHLLVRRSLDELPHLRMEQWIPESIFRSDMDLVQYEYRDRQGRQRKKSKGVCPDAMLIIQDTHRAKTGKPSRAMFLLELDMATHDNSSFGIEKAAAGAAYLKSSVYKDRFGTNAGRWLVVSTSDMRLRNLMKHTKRYARASTDLFFFSTQETLAKGNMLSAPVWSQVGNYEEISLPLSIERD